jgi:hypothetical protein
MATNQKHTAVRPDRPQQREFSAMASNAQSVSRQAVSGRRIPSALLARLQVMFTAGASLEEVCAALDLDTAPVQDAGGLTADAAPVAPPHISEKKLDALTSLVAALRHQVAALVQISEEDGASYAHVVGPVTATVHALATEIDDLRNGDARVYRDESAAERKRRIAAQRARTVANDTVAEAVKTNPQSDLARLQAVRRTAAAGAKAEAARPASRPDAAAAQIPARAQTTDFETAAADARRSAKPKANPLADVLARTRSAKTPKAGAPQPTAQAKAPSAPQTAPKPKLRVAPAAKTENAEQAPSAKPDSGVTVAKDAVAPNATGGAFDAIARPKPPRPRSPEVKPLQPAASQPAQDDAGSRPVPQMPEQTRTLSSPAAPAAPSAPAPTAVPTPVKRFTSPAASGPSPARADTTETRPAPAKTIKAPTLRNASADRGNPFRNRLDSAMGLIKDTSRGNDAIDDEAFRKLR